jgi:hypothetical protein
MFYYAKRRIQHWQGKFFFWLRAAAPDLKPWKRKITNATLKDKHQTVLGPNTLDIENDRAPLGCQSSPRRVTIKATHAQASHGGLARGRTTPVSLGKMCPLAPPSITITITSTTY